MKVSDVVELTKIWPRPIALLVGLVLSVVLFLFLLQHFPWSTSLAISVIVALVFATCWVLSRRLQKKPPNKFGFLIAISVDNESTQEIFDRDFASNLKKLLASGSLSDSLWVYQIPKFHLPSEPTEEEAKLFLKNTDSNYILYGQVRTRGEPGNVKHYLDLSGMVLHAQAGEKNQQKLINEFSELLPRRIVAPNEVVLPEFELHSAVSSAVAKYIAGVAIFLSGNHDYAESMYSDAASLAHRLSAEHKVAAKICERIPLRKTEIIIAKATAMYNEWKSCKDDSILREMGVLLTKTPEEGRSYYVWKTLQSIHLIVSQHGSVDHVESLLESENLDDPIVQVNLAFFDLLRGNLKAATRHYRNALDLGVTYDTVEEIFDFMDWYMVFNPEKEIEMHFAVGFVSHLILQDKQLASDAFDLFNQKRNGKYEREALLIKKWIN